MSPSSERALPEDARREARFDAAESAGIFTGVRLCEEPSLHEVAYAVDDAVDLAFVFGLELDLVRPDKIVLALEGEAQKESSQAALKTLLSLGATRVPATASSLYRLVLQWGQKTGANGLFIFTFAGHGLSDQNQDLLVTREFVSRLPVTTGLQFGVLMRDISSAVAPRRLVLLDACRVRHTVARAAETDSDSAMSESFHQAILKNRGSAILSSTTVGGSSYDDPERCNGVFSGSVLDVLQGKIKTAGSDPFIRLGELATAVDRQITSWVALRRPQHLDKTLGISCNFDPESMRKLPLAIDPGQMKEHEALRLRCREALRKLKAELEPPLTGSFLDEVRRQLEKPPGPFSTQLIEGVQRLDGSRHAREALLALYEKGCRDQQIVPGSLSRFRVPWRSKILIAVFCAAALAALAPSHLIEFVFPVEPFSEEKNADVPDPVATPRQNPGEIRQDPGEETGKSRPSPAEPPVTTKTQEIAPSPKLHRIFPDTYYFNGVLKEGTPQYLNDYDATVAIAVSSELGIDIVTVIWVPQGKPLDKKPVYNAGAELVFDYARGKVRFEVLEIDWGKRQIRWSSSPMAPASTQQP